MFNTQAQPKKLQEKEWKHFKDPFYGYLKIDRTIVETVIDTPTFQRLKDIRQTSYTPLYPAAHHNRFTHSLGVYYLGHIAFKSIRPQLKKFDVDLGLDIPRIQELFELACLLHDVGHAPFSHTGEDFYLAGKPDALYLELISAVHDDKFEADFHNLGATKPEPHECMSCLVALRKFGAIIGESGEERSLFARCILGMAIKIEPLNQALLPKETDEPAQRKTAQLQDKHQSCTRATELKNCVISLLNSSIIDVDRLDYIIRDAGTIGFESARVDYQRLLNGMRIVLHNEAYCIGYHKSAISVIESAVYAHDAEKKWIQNHPAILYEAAALKYAMATLNNLFRSKQDENPIFCYEALTEEGKDIWLNSPLLSEADQEKLRQDSELSDLFRRLPQLKELGFLSNIDFEEETIAMKQHISLLADEDFLHLMKTHCRPDDFGHEYFARNDRRSAVWKSEAEFRAIFSEKEIGQDTLSRLVESVQTLAKFAEDGALMPLIDEKIIYRLEEERENVQEKLQNQRISRMNSEDLMKKNADKMLIAKALKDAARKVGIPFEFLIVSQNRFTSSFKESVLDIPIQISNLEERVCPLRTLMPVMQAQEESRSRANFFHIFYRAEGALSPKRKLDIVTAVSEALKNNTPK